MKQFSERLTFYPPSVSVFTALRDRLTKIRYCFRPCLTRSHVLRAFNVRNKFVDTGGARDTSVSEKHLLCMDVKIIA